MKKPKCRKISQAFLRTKDAKGQGLEVKRPVKSYYRYEGEKNWVRLDRNHSMRKMLKGG